MDVNVLLYASDQESRFHERARDLVERLVRGPELLYLFWPVLMGYLRMATHPAIFRRPLPAEHAISNVEALLGVPHVRTVGASDDYWRTYTAATAGMVVRGNLVPDAHLVALMRENEVVSIWTHDRDFRKFEGIRVSDPFA